MTDDYQPPKNPAREPGSAHLALTQILLPRESSLDLAETKAGMIIRGLEAEGFVITRKGEP